MEWKNFLLAFFFVVALISADETDEELLEMQKRANKYIDTFVSESTTNSGGLIDPLGIEDLKKSFEKEIGFVTVKGEASLYNCSIVGLSTLQKKGDAVGLDLDEDIIMSAELEFGKLSASCKGVLKLNDIGPRITANAKIGKSGVSMFLSCLKQGGTCKLLSFSINELNDMRVSVYGLGTFVWATSLFASLILNFLEKHAARFASDKLTDFFSEEIAKVPYAG